MAFNKNTIRLLQNIFLNTFYSFNVRQNFMKKKRAGDNWKKSEIIKMASTSNREKGEKKKSENLAWNKYVEAMNLSKSLKL